MPYYKNEETMTVHSLGRGQSSHISSSLRLTLWIISRACWLRPPHVARVAEKFCVPLRMGGRPWETHFFLQLPLHGILVIGKYSGSLHEVGKDFRTIWVPMVDQVLNFTLLFLEGNEACEFQHNPRV